MQDLVIFTIIKNEEKYLPIWAKHYKQFNCDLFVLNHETNEAEALDVLDECKRIYNLNVVNVYNQYAFSHEWLASTVSQFQSFLLQSYKTVLFVEVDEIVVGNLSLTEDQEGKSVTCYEIYHQYLEKQEPSLIWDKPLFAQREKMFFHAKYCKPLFAKRPIKWTVGFHYSDVMLPICPNDLIMFHLHRIDFNYLLQRLERNRKLIWSEKDLTKNWGWQNRLQDQDIPNWYQQIPAELQDIPLEYKHLI